MEYKINELIRQAVEANASDVFITVGVPPKMKVGHSLIPLGEERLDVEDSQRLVESLFMRRELSERFQRERSVDFSYSVRQLGRFRVSAFFQRGSMAASIRIVRTEVPDPRALHIPDEVLAAHTYKNGLVLVTGPSGSGKSTTLAAIVNLINETREGHIITIEDPIEFLHTHHKCIVNQREIGLDCPSYAEALRASMREAPDVILIGEMRDLETISAAITAAETGHLVLSTLHTQSAAGAIDRIVDVFPTGQQQQIRVQLAGVLRMVVAQKLITAGKAGVCPAFEIMTVNNAIQNLIRTGNTHQINMMIEAGRSEGMLTMRACLNDLCSLGVITSDEAKEALP